jgi:hypothetical protein
LGPNFFLRDNHFMSHFSGHFEGASTFLTPKLSHKLAHKVIVPQKKIMSRSFLNSGTLIVRTCCFCVRNLFPFPLATALFIGDVSTNFTCSIRFAYSRCENSHIQ